MKTNFKYLMIATAMLAGFTSCNNDDESGADNGKEKNVLVSFNLGEASTYSVGGSVADQTPADFTSGHMYFFDASGDIKKHVTLDKVGVSTNDHLNINDIQKPAAGRKISNIAGTPTKVLIVGNVPAGVTMPTVGNISVVKAKALTITSQNSATAAITNVSLYGEGTIDNVSGIEYKADFTIQPLVARVEINQIKAGGSITGYRVDGIFVNNYYSDFQFGGTAGTLVNNGGTAANNANYGGATDKYTALNTLLADYDFASGIGFKDVLTYYPNSGKSDVWAYNVFATSAVPTITIRLSNITSSEGLITGPRFISIKGFKDKATGTSLTAFAAGKVYKTLGNLVFTEDDLTIDPFDATINVTVQVDVLKWTELEVTPEL